MSCGQVHEGHYPPIDEFKKTILAAGLAYYYGNRFPGGVFWLNMKDPEFVAYQVARCARVMELDLLRDHFLLDDEHSYDELIAAVRNAWQKPIDRLLIFNDLEDPALLRWRPSSGGCRVLIMTHHVTWTDQDGIRVVPLLLDSTKNDTVSNQSSQDSFTHTHAHKEKIDLLLEGNIQDFNPIKEEELRRELAEILGINLNEITITNVQPGSIIITVELPEESFLRLVEMYLNKDPRLESLNIKNILFEKINSIETQIKITTTNTDKSQNNNINFNRIEDNEINELEQELDHQIKLVKEQKRRLRFLELQKARQGGEVNAAIVTEIEDIQSSIDDCRKKIDVLKLSLQYQGTSKIQSTTTEIHTSSAKHDSAHT